MTMRLGTAVAQAMCDALVDQADAGAGAGYVEIRTGAQPASVATAASGTLLGTLTLADPAFGAATTASPAVATANAVTGDSSADASGTAGWFRVYDSAGTARWDGAITGTGGGGDMEISNVNVVAGGTINITAWTVSMPTG
jgi:hypothetical protein